MHGMTSIFTKEKTYNVRTITTLEIAEMMNTEHGEILKKLEGATKTDGSVKQVGIMPNFSEGKIPVADFLPDMEVAA